MVQAGAPVDAVIESLIPLLDEGDMIIDGGNTLYTDTIRREEYVVSKGLKYIGAGVSGGEEGALKGPSIMPSGDPSSWDMVRPIFEAISAKVDNEPCVTHIGLGGSGHFVDLGNGNASAWPPPSTAYLEQTGNKLPIPEGGGETYLRGQSFHPQGRRTRLTPGQTIFRSIQT